MLACQNVSPWFFRRNVERAEYAIAAYGGGMTGHFRFWRDWSLWVLCEACYSRAIRCQPPLQPWRNRVASSGEAPETPTGRPTLPVEGSLGRLKGWLRRYMLKESGR